MPGSSYVDKRDKREGAVLGLTGGEPASYQQGQPAGAYRQTRESRRGGGGGTRRDSWERMRRGAAWLMQTLCVCTPVQQPRKQSPSNFERGLPGLAFQRENGGLKAALIVPRPFMCVN